MRSLAGSPTINDSHPVDYEEAANLILPSSLLPGHLPQNIAETDRVTKRFPDGYNGPQSIHGDIIRELLDPCPTSNSPLDIDMASPGVDNQTATPELLLEVLSPSDPTQNYVYNPRHMLCLMCLTEELSMRFWGWWLRERKLPPVNAPLQENCRLGFSCTQQRRADHAREVDVSLSATYMPPLLTLDLALLPSSERYGGS